MPALFIFMFIFVSLVIFLPISIIEDIKELFYSLIFCCIFLFGWFGFSMQYPTEILQETIYPIKEVEYDKGKIQIIIKDGKILPISDQFKSYLDAEKFDIKIIEYKNSYAGIKYLIYDNYEIVEKK